MKPLDNAAYDLIDRYWNATLSATEKAAFEQRLQDDAAFAANVRLHKAIDTTIANKKEAAFLNTLNTIREKEAQKIRTPEQLAKEIAMPIRRHYTQALFAIAATLLLLVACWFVLQQSKTPTDYVKQYAQHDDISLTDKSSASAGELKQAEQFFNRQEYAQAIPFFERYLENNPEDYSVRLYNARAKFHANQLTEADKELDTIMDSDSIRQLKEQAVWYKALILYKQGKIAACLQRLDQLKYASNKDLQFRALEFAEELKE